MSEELELKHLAPYLPYGLDLVIQIYASGECQGTTKMDVSNIETVLSMVNKQAENKAKFPILRPLSDLTKEITVNVGVIVPMEFLERTAFNELLTSPNIELMGDLIGLMDTEYWIVNALFQWHFDVFGLIKKGLAVDINTLELATV